MTPSPSRSKLAAKAVALGIDISEFDKNPQLQHDLSSNCTKLFHRNGTPVVVSYSYDQTCSNLQRYPPGQAWRSELVYSVYCDLMVGAGSGIRDVGTVKGTLVEGLGTGTELGENTRIGSTPERERETTPVLDETTLAQTHFMCRFVRFSWNGFGGIILYDLDTDWATSAGTSSAAVPPSMCSLTSGVSSTTFSSGRTYGSDGSPPPLTLDNVFGKLKHGSDNPDDREGGMEVDALLDRVNATVIHLPLWACSSFVIGQAMNALVYNEAIMEPFRAPLGFAVDSRAFKIFYDDASDNQDTRALREKPTIDVLGLLRRSNGPRKYMDVYDALQPVPRALRLVTPSTFNPSSLLAHDFLSSTVRPTPSASDPLGSGGDLRPNTLPDEPVMERKFRQSEIEGTNPTEESVSTHEKIHKDLSLDNPVCTSIEASSSAKELGDLLNTCGTFVADKVDIISEVDTSYCRAKDSIMREVFLDPCDAEESFPISTLTSTAYQVSSEPAGVLDASPISLSSSISPPSSSSSLSSSSAQPSSSSLEPTSSPGVGAMIMNTVWSWVSDSPA